MKVKKIISFISALLTATVFLTPINFAIASIPKMPGWVKEDMRNQIETILGEESWKRIPLADPNIDWDNYKNWPKEFFYKGNKFVLEIPYEGKRFVQDKSGIMIDPDNAQHSIEEIPSGTAFELHYYPEKRNVDSGLEPQCIWRSNGSVSEKILAFRSGGDSKNVFSCRYRPTGELLVYSRYDMSKQALQKDYFDKQANTIGSLISSNSGDIYKENGVIKDLKAYNQLIDKLNKENLDDPLPYLGVIGEEIQK